MGDLPDTVCYLTNKMGVKLHYLFVLGLCAPAICQASILSQLSNHELEYGKIAEEIVLKILTDNGIGSDMVQQVSRLRQELATQGETIMYLQDQVKSQQASITDLEMKNNIMENEIGSFQTQLKKQRNGICDDEDVETAVNMKTKGGSVEIPLTDEEDHLFDTSDNGNEMVVNLNPKNVIKKRQMDVDVEGVAFSAYLDHTVMHMGPGHTIKCNQLILNDGNAYNPLTGTFTIPYAGVYLFTFTVEVHMGQTEVNLVLDGINQVDIVSRPNGSGEAIMATNTVILRASKGQSVWIENYRGTDSEVTSGSDTRHVTFSGYQLY